MTFFSQFDKNIHLSFDATCIYFNLPGIDGKMDSLTLPISFWNQMAIRFSGRTVKFNDLARWWGLGVAYAVLAERGSEAEQVAIREILEKELPDLWDFFAEGGTESVRTWPESSAKWYRTIWPKLQKELGL